MQAPSTEPGTRSVVRANSISGKRKRDEDDVEALQDADQDVFVSAVCVLIGLNSLIRMSR